jgi:hypothetical protein
MEALTINGVELEVGGCIIPALRYDNATKAIDSLCEAFGLEEKMVMPGEDGRIAHAQLKLGNGMIMLSDIKTEFSELIQSPTRLRAPIPKRSMSSSSTPTPTTPAPRWLAPRSFAGLRRKTMAAATTCAATSKAISGCLAPTILGLLERRRRTVSRIRRRDASLRRRYRGRCPGRCATQREGRLGPGPRGP